MSSMASLPTQVPTRQRDFQMDPRKDGQDSARSADQDSAGIVELAERASLLTLSTSGEDMEEPRPSPDGDPGAQLHKTAQVRTPAPPTDTQPLSGPEVPKTLPSQESGLPHEQGSPSPSACPPACPPEHGIATWSNGSLTLSMDERWSRTFLAGNETESMGDSPVVSRHGSSRQLADLPNEVLLHILSYLDVSDLLATSRTSHHFRSLSLSPTLHRLRLRHARAVLPPKLTSPSRPSLADLVRRSIFLTNTVVASRRLSRSFASIRLSRRLATRPSPEVLVERCVLPPECLPPRANGAGVSVAPALVARKRAVERERIKDGLRRWVGSVWRGEVRLREEGVRKWEERVGVGRVWRLRRFWEKVGNGEAVQDRT